MTRKLAIALLLIVAVAGMLCAPAHAQEGISASYDAQVSFPTEIVFNITAASPDDITDIYLRYRVDEITTVRVTTVVQPVFDHAPQVETAWTWQMKKSLTSLPPGARVYYSWKIEDAAGRAFETPWEMVRFNDDRYSWNELTQGNITLYWYKDDLSFAQALLSAADGALDRLAADAGVTLQRPVSAYIYATAAEVRSAVLYSPDWTGGVAFPEYATIAIPADQGSLASGKRYITHELAHLVTYQMTFNPYNDLPRWLDEGISTYAEGDLRYDLAAALEKAISSDSLLSIQTISSNFPSDINQAKLSYGESYSVVQFLVQRYGAAGMARLLQIFQQGATYDDALTEAYGLDTAQLDNLWRESLGLGPRETPVTASPTATPAAAPFGCQGASSDLSALDPSLFALLGLLLLPAAAELLQRRRSGGRQR
jgi:hypothetical protein